MCTLPSSASAATASGGRRRLMVTSGGMLLVAMTGVAGRPALAHARLERSDPAAGEAVSAAPEEVSLWFSECLEAALCRIEVFDAAGQRVDQGNVRVGTDAKRLTMRLLRPLGPGAYRVAWRVVSVDTHRIAGAFSFTVAP